MSLWPELEREFTRVAAEPLPASVSGPHRARARLGVALAVAVVAAVVLLVATLPRHGARGGSPSPASPPAAAPLPRTQGGRWIGGAVSCPRAPAERYVPADSGCVSVLRADVEGNGRDQLVVLYARLTSRRVGDSYAPGRFVLEVVRPSGAVVRTRLPPGPAPGNASIVEHGRMSPRRGQQVVIQTSRVSSGSTALIYSWSGHSMVSSGITFAYGGDSVDRQGFACPGPATVVGYASQWQNPGPADEKGWRTVAWTYAWSGTHLRPETHTVTRHPGGLGALPHALNRLGVGCGQLTPAGRP